MLEKAEMDISQIDHWVPHQANIRIIKAAGRELKMPMENTLITLDQYGNSSAATIPFSLSKLKKQRQYKQGDKILFSSIGAGFVSGSLIYGL